MRKQLYRGNLWRKWKGRNRFARRNRRTKDRKTIRNIDTANATRQRNINHTISGTDQILWSDSRRTRFDWTNHHVCWLWIHRHHQWREHTPRFKRFDRKGIRPLPHEIGHTDPKQQENEHSTHSTRSNLQDRTHTKSRTAKKNLRKCAQIDCHSASARRKSRNNQRNTDGIQQDRHFRSWSLSRYRRKTCFHQTQWNPTPRLWRWKSTHRQLFGRRWDFKHHLRGRRTTEANCFTTTETNKDVRTNYIQDNHITKARNSDAHTTRMESTVTKNGDLRRQSEDVKETIGCKIQPDTARFHHTTSKRATEENRMEKKFVQTNQDGRWWNRNRIDMVQHQAINSRYTNANRHVHHIHGHGQQQRSHQTDHERWPRSVQHHLGTRSKHDEKTQREEENLDPSTRTGNREGTRSPNGRLARPHTSLGQIPERCWH